jgi:hypothetical protein
VSGWLEAFGFIALMVLPATLIGSASPDVWGFVVAPVVAFIFGFVALVFLVGSGRWTDE